MFDGDESFTGFLYESGSNKAGDVLFDSSDLGPLGADFIGGVVLKTIGGGADFIGVGVGKGNQKKRKYQGLHKVSSCEN